jgi:hypothetical protein
MTDRSMMLIEKNSHNELITFLDSQNKGSDDFAADLDMSMGNDVEIPNRIKLKDLVDHEGFTLLHMAVFKNKQKCFEVLMKRAANEMET